MGHVNIYKLNLKYFDIHTYSKKKLKVTKKCDSVLLFYQNWVRGKNTILLLVVKVHEEFIEMTHSNEMNQRWRKFLEKINYARVVYIYNIQHISMYSAYMCKQ